jgi:eukaryotic-like serine/threonine-protein kinase
MKRARPETVGFVPGAPLPPFGRATRFACEGGTELFRLETSDESAARRLLSLGEASVGGFVDGGTDEYGVWIVRGAFTETLTDRLRTKKSAWPWRDALVLALAVAEGLAACEKASLFPGPLSLDTLQLGADGRVALTASRLVAAILGAKEGATRADTEASAPMWTPPDQARGSSWDNAANRYVLGLLLYRLLSGEHPFAGAGLRHALDAAQREAPPFVESVAQELPAGLQSFVLRLIHPSASERPDRAAAIVIELGRFLRGESPARVPAGRTRPSKTKPSPDDVAAPPAVRLVKDEHQDKPTVRSNSVSSPTIFSKYPWLGVAIPVAAGAILAAFAVSRIEPPPPPRPRPEIPPATFLSARSASAEDCAGCHARQAGEWRRSVMAHSVKSPLFNALESLIEEQVGRDEDCPHGAGILRRVNNATACRDRNTGIAITGSGGQHWCVNCHSPAEKLEAGLRPWEGTASGDPSSRRPVRDLLGSQGISGISCVFCHSVHGPVPPSNRDASAYRGNESWISFLTGAVFLARPEDRQGIFGIGNSGYDMRPELFFFDSGRFSGNTGQPVGAVDPVVHRRPDASAKSYLQSSEFCGSCHDVRLFGTDVIGVRQGEHFKRLRNAYTEWTVYAQDMRRRGKNPATCQDCHMSTYPGICEPGAPKSGQDEPECPSGMHFVARPPGAFPEALQAANSPKPTTVTTHYFSGVDIPLYNDFPQFLVDEQNLDVHGLPLGARRRRDMLLRHTFRFEVDGARRSGAGVEIPIVIENIGAGHRIPAGFSQEREFWVHLVVRDGSNRVLYEVGRVDRPEDDLRDKVFVRVNANPNSIDERGRPVGLFGADVRDGPDVQQWSPPPQFGGTNFRGKGLINFQNGFLRCVRCIGVITSDGRCEPGPGQGFFRADRFDDGDYDLDTGECRSNLFGENALFETYFPVGALDASRGFVRGPDAIIDTRSLPAFTPLRYTYDLDFGGRRGPYQIEARLMFRSFPPFLIKAFAQYEREQARRGLRPSGPSVTEDMLQRLDIVELHRITMEVQ